MTPFLHLYSWHAVGMSLSFRQRETGTEEKRDTVCLHVHIQ